MGLRRAFAQSLPDPGWLRQARDGVVVALFALDEWRPWLGEAEAMLDRAESMRVQHRRIATDREMLALTYALHRLLLSAVLARDPLDVPLMRDERGRPCVGDESVQTSLSHSDGVAAIAVATKGVVGVDIEPVSRAPAMAEIAERICHPQELHALQHLEEPEYGLALLALWGRKEALLKAAGTGMAREMESFLAPENLALPLHPGEPAMTTLSMLEAGGGYMAALAHQPGLGLACAWLPGRARRDSPGHLQDIDLT